MKQLGFTLVELMVALTVSLVLILSVSLSYSSIKRVTQTTSELENAQEVLRYSSLIFTRSIKQTQQPPAISAGNTTLTVQQQGGTLSCLGTQPAANYSEIFRFANGRLSCDIGGGAQDILIGVTAITFDYSNVERILTINVSPDGLPLNYGGSVAITIAASSIWLQDFYGTL